MNHSAPRTPSVRTCRAALPAAAAALSAALMLAGAACDRNAEGQSKGQRGGIGRPPAATVPVSVRAAVTRPVQRSVDITGTLYGDEEAVISAKVPGRIVKLYKDVGDTVRPGEPLVQLKPNDYQLAVNKAQLAMEEALAKIGLTELPPKSFDVTTIPPVVRAKLQWENAEGKYERGKKLFEADPPLLSEQDFKDLETALRVAKTAYDVEVLNARAAVAEAWSLKGDVEIAAQRLTDATTRAPSPPLAEDLPPGSPPPDPVQAARAERVYHVVARLVNEGELVREITPCYRLVDDNPIKLRARVPERFISQVEVGQRVKASVEARPGQEFVGTVARIAPQVDPENRTFQIEVVILNDGHPLRPGEFAKASVLTRVEAGVVFVPQDAVVTFAGVTKVYTVDKDNRAVEVSVQVGDATTPDGYVEIAGGLKGDERVVVTGASRLATGVPVVIQEPATRRAPATRAAPAKP